MPINDGQSGRPPGAKEPTMMGVRLGKVPPPNVPVAQGTTVKNSKERWISPKMVGQITGLIVALAGAAYGGVTVTEGKTASARQLKANNESSMDLAEKLDGMRTEVAKLRSVLTNVDVRGDIEALKAADVSLTKKDESHDAQLGVLHRQSLWHASWICQENEGSPAPRHAIFPGCSAQSWHEQPPGNTPHRYTDEQYPKQ